MAPFTIVSCTVDDGPALARNYMSAFWQDSTWVLIWREKTLDHIVSQAALRMPRNLLTDRPHRRHQKAVDAISGAVVGYTRWILPEVGTETAAVGDLDILWPEAQVPAISGEQEHVVKRNHAAADWSWDHTVDELDVPVTEMKNRLMKRKNYLGECFHPGSCCARRR